MAKRAVQRETVIEQAAAFVLEHGLGAASLRTLATAAGVSDRMLLYYFADKAELMQAVVERLAGRMALTLAAAVGPERRSPEALQRLLWTAVRATDLAPFMRLWLEIAAAAGRNDEAMRVAGGRIAAAFQAFIAARLDLEEAQAPGVAARLLAVIDGAAVLDSVGVQALADLAMNDWSR